jgi:hypothetical protein
LATVCARLPAEVTTAPCGKAADVLLAALGKAPLYERQVLCAGLAAVAGRLPADKAAEVCQKATDILFRGLDQATSDSELRALAEGMATVCAWLPAERAAAVCGKAAEVLTEVMKDSTEATENRLLALGLAAVTPWLPAENAAEVGGTSAVLLLASVNQTHGKEWQECIEGLATACTGLGPAVRFRRLHQSSIGSLSGSVTFPPDFLPKPRPLPPQQLVELLKHPFCVKEARRAVLDALEFTYEREFTDLWDLVAFAETEHPELDLLTPPRRPERK